MDTKGLINVPSRRHKEKPSQFVKYDLSVPQKEKSIFVDSVMCDWRQIERHLHVEQAFSPKLEGFPLPTPFADKEFVIGPISLIFHSDHSI